jgi:hypothetical protein
MNDPDVIVPRSPSILKRPGGGGRTSRPRALEPPGAAAKTKASASRSLVAVCDSGVRRGSFDTAWLNRAVLEVVSE